MNKKTFSKNFFVCFVWLFVRKFFAGRKSSSSLLEIVYQESFTDIEEGELPEDLFVLDGSFEVIKKDGNKCLKLSGSQLGNMVFFMDRGYLPILLKFHSLVWEQ